MECCDTEQIPGDPVSTVPSGTGLGAAHETGRWPVHKWPRKRFFTQDLVKTVKYIFTESCKC